MTIRDSFVAQGAACEALGSPFMARLMPLIGARLTPGSEVADRLLKWSGDTSPSGDSVPLRLAGALHALKIQGLALGEVYPPHQVDDDVLWKAVEDAFLTHADALMEWLGNPPQTNEIRRSAPLIAAMSVIGQRYVEPIELLELGCSAGLNLRADRFRILAGSTSFGPADAPLQIAPTWTGPSPSPLIPKVVARKGVDLTPIDPASENGRLRLLAYLWPDQKDRAAMTNAAIQTSLSCPAEVSSSDAGEWIERILASPASDRVRVIFHTVAWQYFPEETKRRALIAMKETEKPLVRFSMEADGGRGAQLTLTHYPSCEEQDLGRADFHGRWVAWNG